jgi:hypothetical protein
MTDITRLLSILALKRGHGSIGEDIAVERFLIPYNPGILTDKVTGEISAYVITTDNEARTLFSCHTDTVHSSTTASDTNNHVVYDANLKLAYKDKTDPTPLGADDGAGWWLMMEMIDAEIPGTYLFHRGEERGGIGSKAIARDYEDFLKTFDKAVAFDRRGTTSVITEQGWSGACASTEFAAALAAELNATTPGFAFEPDDTGIYTDTAEYAHLIPECTNLSCGYENEHSHSEILDVEFLIKLRDACLIVNWDALPTKRTPARPVFDKYDFGAFEFRTAAKKGKKGKTGLPEDEFDVADMGYRQAVKYCKEHPEEAADLLLVFADQLVEAYETREAFECNQDTRQYVGQQGFPASLDEFNDY